MILDIKKLDLYNKVDNQTMRKKLKEECEEVRVESIWREIALKEVEKNNIFNETFYDNKYSLASELLDVIQVCVGIAYINDINLEDYILSHKLKLKSRGHKLSD